jgi:hypothetical protein
MKIILKTRNDYLVLENEETIVADIKLFSITNEVQEIKSSSVSLEKELQTHIESNMEALFGVRAYCSPISA